MTKNQKIRNFYTNGKKISVVDMLIRYVTQEELQLNQTKHKQLLSKTHFATLTLENEQKTCILII